MDKLIKLNAQTSGRDKIARLFQYLTRVIWHKLKQNNKNGADNFKNLEFQLSTFRKLLRFGKCIDTLYSIPPLLQHGDQTVKVTVIASKLSSALFLLMDHILWLGRSDLCTVDTDTFGRLSSKYWLYSLVFALIRDLYEIFKILRANESRIIAGGGVVSWGQYVEAGTRAFACVMLNRNVVVDLVKNSCDFFIPLTALGYTKLSPGTVGVLGVISSLAGLLVLADSNVKLNP